MKRWADQKQLPCFVLTSNVDGHFQTAGFAPEQVYECHGSIHYLQCTVPCGQHIWPVGELLLSVDKHSLKAKGKLPRCPHCGAIARPNILMFADDDWHSDWADQLYARFQTWQKKIQGHRLVVIEVGAGNSIPTIRWISESIVRANSGATLIRINPREAEGPPGTLSLPLSGLDALRRLDHLMGNECS